jgi:tRNA (cytidine/uridine-2'-O-)-methyltransferase
VSLLHVVLVEPKIPQNTGNIGRLCAYLSLRLHLIAPLGYQLNDKQLKRAGMDYWQHLDWRLHPHFEAMLSSGVGPKRLWLFTTHAKRSFWDVEYAPGDGLVFGSETAGLPEALHQAYEPYRVRIDSANPKPLRSLNLATSVGIGAYEAYRQLRGHCPLPHQERI